MRGGGDITRKSIPIFAGLAVLSLLLAFTPTASASNRFYATEKLPPGFPALAPSRIILTDKCGAAASYSADTAFFVAHGWNFFPWNGSPSADKNAFMSPATTFELWVDGVLQGSTLYAFLVNFPVGQVMFKFYVSENDNGLSGTHTFYGAWYESAAFYGGDYLDRVLSFQCTVSITFT